MKTQFTIKNWKTDTLHTVWAETAHAALLKLATDESFNLNDLEVIAHPEPRSITLIRWDGASNPVYRYTDEMHLPDYRRAGVTKADIEANK